MAYSKVQVNLIWFVIGYFKLSLNKKGYNKFIYFYRLPKYHHLLILWNNLLTIKIILIRCIRIWSNIIICIYSFVNKEEIWNLLSLTFWTEGLCTEVFFIMLWHYVSLIIQPEIFPQDRQYIPILMSPWYYHTRTPFAAK